MSNLGTLHRGTIALHKKTETLPYLARYGNNTASLVDHWRHLRQLLPIYETLERKLNDKAFSFTLPEELNALLNRSEKIKSDLALLSQYVPAHIKQQDILRSTDEYVQHINNLNMPGADAEIFSHFLIRIFGDLFGGQKIKKHVQAIYTKEKIYSQREPEQGVNFYIFERNMLKTFSSWFNTQQIDDEMTVLHANNAFKHFISIFNELEETRVPFPRTQCCARFFNMNHTKQALLIGAAIVPVATAAWLGSR